MKILEFLRRKHQHKANEPANVRELKEDQKQESVILEDMLTFYMKELQKVTSELMESKTAADKAMKEVRAEKETAKKLISRIEELEQKNSVLEEENLRLSIVEEVWEKTFAKIEILSLESSATEESSNEIGLVIEDRYNIGVDYEE